MSAIPEILEINLGSYANDGTGDDLRTAFQKVNTNFRTIALEGAVLGATGLGNGAEIFVQKNTNAILEFNSLTSSDLSVTLTAGNGVVDLSSHTRLQNDALPTLGGDLDLNGHIIKYGDVHTTVWGFDVLLAENVNSLLVNSNNIKFDMGSITSPAGKSASNPSGYSLDLRGSGNVNFDTPPDNSYDFGYFSETSPVLGTSGTKLSSDAGTPGEVSYDQDYLYVCVADSTWKRISLESY